MQFIFFQFLVLFLAPSANAGMSIKSTPTRLNVTKTPDVLSTLPAGFWLEIPNSKMMSSAYKGPLASSIAGTQGPAGVMNDWNGGVFDTDTRSLLVWGGGHKGYYGNEIYGFSLETLKWTMRSQPSPVSGWDHVSTTYPDGGPASAHSKGSLAYLTGKGLLIVSAEAANDNGEGTISGFLNEIGTGKWIRKARCPGGYYGFSAVDHEPTSPTFGHVFAMNQSQGGVVNGLQDYNPNTDVWTSHGSGSVPSYAVTGAVSGLDGIVVSVGEGVRVIKITSPNKGETTIPTTSGDKGAELASAPGFVWYPPGKVFVAWIGGNSFYTLNPKTWVWTKKNPTAGSTVIPTSVNSTGTYGRFQYDPIHNVFVVVNRVDDNVFVFKPNF